MSLNKWMVILAFLAAQCLTAASAPIPPAPTYAITRRLYDTADRLDLSLRAKYSHATNATLEYSVYLPSDFDFVQEGKLPGLYGGDGYCDQLDRSECASPCYYHAVPVLMTRSCFDTRIRWREDGKGELYLVCTDNTWSPCVPMMIGSLN
jgi:hypothetical protein